MTVKIQLTINLTLMENFPNYRICLEELRKTVKSISVKTAGVQVKIQIKNVLNMKQACQSQHYNDWSLFLPFYPLFLCRLQAETQLTRLLNKYDTDIGQKQAEYDEILAGFNKEKQQMQELMVKEGLTCKLISYLHT
jgi:hypothetical protein